MDNKMSLKAWRRARGYNQKDMAELCGVHLNTYRHWETNPGEVRIDKMIMIADKLQISLDAIILPSHTTKCGK